MAPRMRTVIDIPTAGLPQAIDLGRVANFQVTLAEGRTIVRGMVTGILRSDVPGNVVLEITGLTDPTPEELQDFWP